MIEFNEFKSARIKDSVFFPWSNGVIYGAKILMKFFLIMEAGSGKY